MRELKELFEAAATDPSPPMTSSARMLAEARRSQRRHRGRVAAGGALATVFVVAAAVAVIPSWGGPAATADGGFQAGAAVEVPAVVSDSADVLDAIAAVLPDHLSIRHSGTGDDTRLYDTVAGGQKMPKGARGIGAAAVVYDGPRAGEMSVHVLDLSKADDPARRTQVPPTYFCDTRPAGECETVTVDGVRVSVARDYRLPDHPTISCAYAERSAPGGYVSISICPSLTTFSARPAPAPLTAPIFTDDQLAALTTDKRFLRPPVR